eukprot:GAHX01001433.1.p1 GENE.GAHX01001433.1~~GAHX01001433.1.p1  ORF type:complete len:211 (+),score=34.48 GAHX01001433.1:856-1488(+)
MVTVIVLTASTVFLIQNYRNNKLKKGTSSYKISISFFFLAIANLTGMIAWSINKMRDKPMVKPASWVALDLGKLVPACFALVYLLTEAWGRLSNVSFGVKRILKITKCRRLFKCYLSEIGSKKAYELVCKWEKLSNENVETMDVLDRSDLNKQEAYDYIEKNLEIEIYDFMMTEAFNDFYLTYNFGGKIEANLAEEVELQNTDKRSGAMV